MAKRKVEKKVELKRWGIIEEILKSNLNGLIARAIAQAIISRNPRRNCWQPSPNEITFLCNRYGAEKYRNHGEVYWRLE
jgi:hypothetical protein